MVARYTKPHRSKSCAVWLSTERNLSATRPVNGWFERPLPPVFQWQAAPRRRQHHAGRGQGERRAYLQRWPARPGVSWLHQKVASIWVSMALFAFLLLENV